VSFAPPPDDGRQTIKYDDDHDNGNAIVLIGA